MFRIFYQIIQKSEFNKNVFTLISGQFIAQLISFAVGFIITRIYSPEQIGIYSLFVAITLMLSTVSTGRYEVAIIIEKNEDDVKSLSLLALLISAIFNLTLLLSIIFLPKLYADFIDNKGFVKWLFLVPLSVFITSIIRTLQYYFNKHSKYENMKNSEIIKSSGISSFSVFLGWFQFLNGGLIIANIIGNTSAMLYLLVKLPGNFWSGIKSAFTWTRLKAIAKKYKNYFILYLPSGLLNILVVNSTPLFIVFFFSEKIAGYYFMAEKVVSIPIGLIVASISKVFYQKAAVVYQNDKHKFLEMIKSIQKKMVIFLFPFLLLLSVLSPYFFELFGEGWHYAGEMVKYFALFIFFSDLMSPVGAISNVLNRLDILFYFNISIAFFRILTFYIGSLYLSFEHTLLFSSTVLSLCYLILDIVLKRIIKKEIEGL